MHRRVVITGLGGVTPLGGTIDRFWKALTSGTSSIDRIRRFDAGRYPVQMAAEVRDWSLAEAGVEPRRWERSPHQTQFMIGSALAAAREAGLPDRRMDPLRFGIYFGCGEAFEEFSDFLQTAAEVYAMGDVTARSFLPTALKIFNPEAEAEYEPAAPAAHLAGLLGAHGPNANCITACASATQAIGQAWQIIRRGQADVMLTGGAHSMVHPFGLTGFYPLSTLSTRNEPAQSPRPFDRDRDGFVIGEGGAAVVLEELQHARRRGAEIWAELSGYASAHDAYRVTDVHPKGRGCVQAITRALNHAGINATDLDYVNAHGTGTLLNDRIETLALKRALGPHAYRVGISSTKSMLGHATTASGAIELLACVLAIRHGVVPPTINYQTPDPECDLDYIPNVARELECRFVLNNSIGFGGQNSALIVSRFEEASRSAVSARRAA